MKLHTIIIAVVSISIALLIFMAAGDKNETSTCISVYTNGIPLHDGDELIVRKEITTKIRTISDGKGSIKTIPYSDTRIYAVRKSDVTVTKTVQEIL